MNKQETWNGLREFPVAGRYFELLSVVNPVDVRAFAAGDRVVADERACPAGYFIDRRDRDPFERIEITTGANETVKFLITDGMSGQRGAPASATIIAPLDGDNSDNDAPLGAAGRVAVSAVLKALDSGGTISRPRAVLNADGVIAGMNVLASVAMAYGYNGATFDRIRALALRGQLGRLAVNQDGFLGDWDVENDKAFSSDATSAAVAAQLSYVQLANPVGSGKVIFVDGIRANAGINQLIDIKRNNVILATAVANGVNRNSGGAASSGEVRTASAAVIPGTVGGDVHGSIAVELRLHEFKPAVRLAAGQVLNVGNAVTVNNGVRVVFNWREY